MATNDPSLARRILPALALTGAGLGLVNVLDQPASTSAFGAADQAGIGGDGTSNGDGALAAGNTVPGLTTVPPPPSTSAGSSGGASSAGSGSGTSSGSSSGSASTQNPSTQNPSTQTPSTQTPSTAAPSTSACGAIKSNGSQESISIRGRNYGTVVVSAKFTSSGKLCSVSATYNVSDRRSVQIEEYAIPRLTKQAIAANSANINGISGATAIANAYSRSLQSAIDAK